MLAQNSTRLAARIGSAVMAAAAVLSVCKVSADVPETLNPPAGNVESARWYAVGYQVYVSVRRADDPTKYQWTLKEPFAMLYNGGGKAVGTHFGGPTWQSKNGSRVKGQKDKEVASPDPNSIAWLLIKAVSHEGNGMFSNVTWIQRIDTVGGKAPAWEPAIDGLEIGVPYPATYVVFEAK